MHLFIKHTSASLTINENYSQHVRNDFETHFNKMVPEGTEHYTHLEEGIDDMPAHIKSSILGNSLIIPINKGNIMLGTWQGIYLCEHKNNSKERKIILTIYGD